MGEMFQENIRINQNPIGWLKKNTPEIYLELNCRYNLENFKFILINHDMGLGKDYISIDLHSTKDSLTSIQVVSEDHDRVAFFGDDKTVKGTKKQDSFTASINSLLNIPALPVKFNVYAIDFYTESECIANELLKTVNCN